MNIELLSALLSLDAYNRGYDASVNLPTGNHQVGDAIVVGSDADKADGFFAVEYTYDGETIISYRGTDNPSLWGNDTAGGSDIINGWLAGLGGSADQLVDAANFYQEVTGQSVNSSITPNNVIVTGHSLGGGLAGFISALTGVDAITFNEMPYAAAALGLEYYDIDSLNLSSVKIPNAENVTAYSTAGEILSTFRAIAPDGNSEKGVRVIY